MRRELEGVEGTEQHRLAQVRDIIAEQEKYANTVNLTERELLAYKLQMLGVSDSERAFILNMHDVGDELKRQKELADEFGQSISSAFEDAIINGKNFSDVVKAITDDHIRMALREAVTKPLAKSASGLFESLGISNLLSFDGGGDTGSGSRAGGVDGKGGFLSVLHPNETVIDRTKGQSAGGGTVINISNIDARGSTNPMETERAVQRAVSIAVNQSIGAMRDMRERGDLAEFG